jgi:hypothetical protein
MMELTDRVIALLEKYSGAILVAAIIIILIFTASVWLATYRLWRSSLLQNRATLRSATAAKTSAEAAKSMAQAISVVERAYIHPVIVKDNVKASIRAAIEHKNVSQWPSVQFKLKNYGKTAAFLKDVKAALACWTGTPLAPYDFEEFFPTEAVILPAEETEVFSAWVRTPLSLVDAEQLKNGTGRVYFFGQVQFEDIWGEVRTIPFYRMWDAAKGKFVLHTPDPRKHQQPVVGISTH